MLNRRTWVILIAILAVALTLRTAGLSRLVYANPDEGLWSYFIVTGAQLSWLSPHPTQNALAHVLSWDYGYPLFVLDDLYVRTLEALRLPVSEATLPLPLAVFGALNCLLAFLIARRVAKPIPTPDGARGDTRPHAAWAGLLAAALMAVMPLTVGRSRSIGGAEAFSGFVFLLAALQIMRYLEAPTDRRRQWLAGLCVGLYVCGDVQFLVGGAVLLGLVALWPMGSRLDAARGEEDPSRSVTAPTRLRPLWRPGVLIPPLVLFAPYVPTWLYAIHLGYRDQTYLGTVFAEHKADWGFHLLSFVPDLSRNVGFGVFFVALLALPWFFARSWADRRVRWLALWIGLTAFPFLFAVTSKVTEASGYHEHLAAALAIALGVALARGRLTAFGRMSLATIAVGVALLMTLGGLFRVPALVPLWPAQKIPYGGLVVNSGMKTAGHWVRQALPRDAAIFVAHDPAVAYWYMGRECVTGGLVASADRKRALLQSAATLAAAVIPEQFELYSPSEMRALGFRGRLRVLTGGVERLNIYTRADASGDLTAEDGDRAYAAAIRTSRAIIPPPWPYAPGKPVQGSP